MIALSPSGSSGKTGQLRRKPGLSLVMVVSKFPKFRAEVVRSLQSSFSVEYFSSLDMLVTRMKGRGVPRLIVVDYDLVAHHSRDFVIAKLENEHWCDVPLLVTGKVEEKIFKEKVYQVCRTGYLRRPFLQSNLIEAATRLVDGPIEDQWKTLPTRQREALQGPLSTIRSANAKIKTGKPINLAETRENCSSLLEEVLDGNAAFLFDQLQGHHNHTFIHSLKASSLLSLLGHTVGVKGDELLTITTAGVLMDIGKLATPQNLLNSPEPLSPDEVKEMRRHVIHSRSILNRGDGVPEGVRVVAEQHHERIDGSGYPRGLKGKQLNELARFAAIVDVFCALTEDRPYKAAHSVEDAFEILETMKGPLDPFMLALFKQVALVIYKAPPQEGKPG